MDSSREVVFPVKVVIDKTKRKLVFAEANGDFVDVLFSFLTLPMGTIVRLLDKNSDQTKPHNIGSLNNLYKSMANLDDKYFTTQECKNMLIYTRNSAEAQCRKLKMNFDDTKPIQYFICENLNCTKDIRHPSLSTYIAASCRRCGRYMNRQIGFESCPVGATECRDKGAFVTDVASFVITEDLHVIPNVLGSTLGLIKRNGIKDFGVLEEKTIEFGRNEVLRLLEYSIISRTPLTDIVIGRKYFNFEKAISILRSHISSLQGNNNDKNLTIKVFIQRSNNRILLGQTSADFIDFLFSFLTIPLGRVNSLLRNNYTPTPCVENIHQSVLDLNVDGYLKAQELKEMLLSPRLAMGCLLSNHILPLEVETAPTLYFSGTDSQNHYYLSFNDHLALGNKFMLANANGGGFVRRQTMFMVTDDLAVTPLSSMSCITYIHCLKVPPSDIEEQELSIGVEEALNILRASLNSTSVLTDALQHLIQKNPKLLRIVLGPPIEEEEEEEVLIPDHPEPPVESRGFKNLKKKKMITMKKLAKKKDHKEEAC